ncbi:MAG: hypothetical protein H7232_17390 [Aeromicrobium sp.]|nr:hypothetical protein [Burkholderiales bacterium]
MDYFSKPKTLILTRRILSTQRQSKESNEIEFKVWRLERETSASELQFTTYLCGNSLLGIPSIVQGFDDMDALAKCIREIDTFLMAYLVAFDLTFENSLPYTYLSGSAFFDDTQLELRGMMEQNRRAGDKPS